MRQILNMHPMRSLPNNQLPLDTTATESLLNEDTKNEKYKWLLFYILIDFKLPIKNLLPYTPANDLNIPKIYFKSILKLCQTSTEMECYATHS